MRHRIMHDSKLISVNDISDKIAKEIKNLLNEGKYSEDDLKKEGIFFMDFIIDIPSSNKLSNGNQFIDKKILCESFSKIDNSGLSDERCSIRNYICNVIKNY